MNVGAAVAAGRHRRVPRSRNRRAEPRWHRSDAARFAPHRDVTRGRSGRTRCGGRPRDTRARVACQAPCAGPAAPTARRHQLHVVPALRSPSSGLGATCSSEAHSMKQAVGAPQTPHPRTPDQSTAPTSCGPSTAHGSWPARSTCPGPVSQAAPSSSKKSWRTISSTPSLSIHGEGALLVPPVGGGHRQFVDSVGPPFDVRGTVSRWWRRSFGRRTWRRAPRGLVAPR